MTTGNKHLDDEIAAAQAVLLLRRKKLGIDIAPPQSTSQSPVLDFPVQDSFPIIRDYEQERRNAAANYVEKLMKNWSAPLTGEVLWTARCLVLCGLPVNPTDAPRVSRTARLADGTYLRVTFIRTHDQIPLPYRQDRAMVHFITHKAVINQSPWLHWAYVNEFLAMFGLPVDSGKNYRIAQERFIRVVYLDIMIEHLDPAGGTVDHFKVPLVEGARISARVDEAGKWSPMETAAQMLKASDSARVGQVFYDKLLKDPVPIPLELLVKTYDHPRLQDFAIFSYWRAFAADDESFIPWDYLRQQFDSTDKTASRWRIRFEQACAILKALPDPFPRIVVRPTSRGLCIEPLPRGTCFFPGFPKRNGPLPEIQAAAAARERP